MNNDNNSVNMADYAEEMVRAIRRHSAVLDAQDDPREVIAAINSLRDAARHYIQNVLELSGWGNVFADLEEEEEEEEEEVADTPGPGLSATATNGDAPLVVYWHQYKLRVHDFEGARRLLESRSRARNSASCEDYDQSYTGIIAGLAELDGWQPISYDQNIIEVVSAKWESTIEGETPN